MADDVELDTAVLRSTAPSFADAADRVAALIQRAKDANAQYDDRLGDDSYANAALAGANGLTSKQAGLIGALEAMEQRLRGYATGLPAAADQMDAQEARSAAALDAAGGY
jgi:hypothetical protein